MTVTLQLIRETELARLYRTDDGREFWIARDIVERTLKYPDGRHVFELPDWKAKELNLD